MTRLTEKELTEIRQAPREFQREAIDMQSAILRARRLQGEMIAHLSRLAFRAMTRVTGLAALAELIFATVIVPLKRNLRSRRTATQLKDLDDRMLADIGLTRGQIHGVAEELARKSVPSPAVEYKPLARIKRAHARRATIDQLHSLSNHTLADIGIERPDIEMVVNRLFEDEAKRAKTGDVESLSPVHGLMEQIRRTANTNRSEVDASSPVVTHKLDKAANCNRVQAQVA